MRQDLLNLEKMKADLIDLLNGQGLYPKVMSLNLVIADDLFDAIATGHPDYKDSGLLQKGQTETETQLQWGIWIQRKTDE